MRRLLYRQQRQPTPSRLGRRIHTPQQVRAMRASGAMVDITGRDTARPLVEGVRQPWQAQAFAYLGAVGELRYANKFQGNAARKTIFIPAVYVPGEPRPVPIADSDLSQYADIASEALDRLGDVGARGDLARCVMENFKVAGECFLVGRTDSGEGVAREVWEIRSISEIGIREGRPFVRETPGARDGIALGDDDFLARLWTPDPEYRRLADSPVRTAIETCLEELVLLSKDVRASATSRLALNGIYVYPDSWTIERADGAGGADSGEDDPLMAMMIEAGTEAIRDPGSAAAALPILMRAPADSTDKGHHYTFARPETDNAGKRKEALDRLAATLDLPPEIMSGIGGSNHWSAWAISESMWSEHLEPGVQDIAEALTAAYYRRYLAEAGVPDDVVARCLVWYDATNVVVKPDKTAAAGEAHERAEISGTAYREHLGFREDEAPDDTELLKRAALKGLFDPAATLAILQGKPPPEPTPVVDAVPVPELDAPESAEPVEGPPNGGTPPAAPGESTPAIPDGTAMRRRLEAALQRRAIAPPALVAAGTVSPNEAAAISQRLTDIDRQLRERIRMASEAAVKRTLEKAGARLRTKARDPALVAAIRDVPAWSVPYRLGPALVASFGLDETSLLDAVLAELEALWHNYVEGGSTQALRQAARLVNMDVNEAFAVLDGRLRADRAAGWTFLSERLRELAAVALSTDPAEAVVAGRLVSPSVARAALAVAGGFNTPTSRGISIETLLPVDKSEHFGGIGTGTTLKGFMEERGAQIERYQWIYGFSERPFEPHLKVDRKYFDSWDDDALKSPEEAEFVGNHMRPGDHSGCGCDFVLVWAPPPVTNGGVR